MEVTNRELLRHYKTLKEKLLHGEEEEIIVRQKEGVVIKLVVERSENPAQTFLGKVKKSTPFNIERPEEDIF